MGLTDSIIETGVDKLVNLINEKGKISSADAAKELGVSTTVIMEWVDFLEEEGIINLEYKFTKPFLVARKLAKKDVQEKAKEFSGKRDVFVRKAEVSLSFLEKESEKLESLKEEFDKIKKDLGIDIGSVKGELEELKKYEQLKMDLDKKIEEQKTDSINKFQDITKQILREKEKYRSLLQEIKKEEEALERDKNEASTIEQSEKLISNRLNGLKDIIQKIENRAKTEEEHIKNSENNIQKMMLLAKTMQLNVEKEKGVIEPLIEESKIQTGKIKEVQDKIVEKIMSKEKKLKGVKEASQKMEAFFKKKLGVLGLIEKVNKDRNDLQNELIGLIKKAKSFELSSKSRDTGTQVVELEKRFNEVDAKKKLFEEELKKVGSFFR